MGCRVLLEPFNIMLFICVVISHSLSLFPSSRVYGTRTSEALLVLLANAGLCNKLFVCAEQARVHEYVRVQGKKNGILEGMVIDGQNPS